jgi:hypothetical protein
MSNLVIPRRMLGPIDKEMGGDADLTGSDGLTIQNNVAGNMLMATGNPNIISGVSNINFKDGSLNITASVNLSGASNYLYLQGTNAAGVPQMFKFAVSGGVLLAQPT